MTESENTYGPHSPYPPYPGPRWTPPSDAAEVTIRLVKNGWIVSAPVPDEEEVATCGTWTIDTEERVFQFDQKDGMLAYLASATPIPPPPSAP